MIDPKTHTRKCRAEIQIQAHVIGVLRFFSLSDFSCTYLILLSPELLDRNVS